MLNAHKLAHLPEYSTSETLNQVSKELARYELFKLVVDLPGDIIEGGVFQGGGLFCWARLIQIFNPLTRRRVVGFDTFDGFPALSQHQHDRDSAESMNLQNGDARQLPLQEVLDLAELQRVNHRIELVQGNATDTIPQYVADNPGFRIALLNLDFDTYEPTAVALQHLYPLVVPGGVIALDEYSVRGWGESDAVDEFFQGANVRYHAFPWATSPKAFLIKDAPQRCKCGEKPCSSQARAA